MDDNHRSFCQTVIDNIKKNGFPEKRVALPLVPMYEAAERKGVNMNKVLETLESIRIDHKKTPEKIIFFPADRSPALEPPEKAASEPTAPFPGMAALADLDFSSMDMGSMMSMAAEMMKKLTPEQLAAARSMYDNMSDEEKSALIDQAKEMGMFPNKPR